MFQEVRSLPRVSDTTVAIIPPPKIPHVLTESGASLRLRQTCLHGGWFTDAALQAAWFTLFSGRVCLSCKRGKLTINLFCRHRCQHGTDGVVTRSCLSDVFLMFFKCWGWEEVKKHRSYDWFVGQALICPAYVQIPSQCFLDSSPCYIQLILIAAVAWTIHLKWNYIKSVQPEQIMCLSGLKIKTATKSAKNNL